MRIKNFLYLYIPFIWGFLMAMQIAAILICSTWIPTDPLKALSLYAVLVGVPSLFWLIWGFVDYSDRREAVKYYSMWISGKRTIAFPEGDKIRINDLVAVPSSSLYPPLEVLSSATTTPSENIFDSNQLEEMIEYQVNREAKLHELELEKSVITAQNDSERSIALSILNR